MKKSLSILLLFSIASFTFAQKSKEILYVGTYSIRGSEGIYVYEFDRTKGTFQFIQAVTSIESPTYLTVHPSGKYLYAVNRGALSGHMKLGSVSAYSIDRSTGKLTLLNQQSSFGDGPCYVSTDKTGKLAFVTNYNEGNLIVFPISENGSLEACSDSIRFTGSGVNPERQTRPHIHCVIPSPDNKHLIVTDLGTDKVYSFVIDHASAKLKPAPKPFTSVKPGSGPRHITFHPNGKYIYAAEELTSTVAHFAYKKETGDLTLLQDQIASMPVNSVGQNSSADIHTDIHGKYLMMSNRGHNSLSVYSVAKDGSLSFLHTQNTKGEKPRNFLVDQRNRYVFVAHQDTDNVVVFRWNEKTGKLIETGFQLKVPSPVCLKMVELD